MNPNHTSTYCFIVHADGTMTSIPLDEYFVTPSWDTAAPEPVTELAPGKYRLRTWTSNPSGNRDAKDDWRLKPYWDTGDTFQVYDLYHLDTGRCVAAIYQGRDCRVCVHLHHMPGVFLRLAPLLERAT